MKKKERKKEREKKEKRKKEKKKQDWSYMVFDNDQQRDGAYYLDQ